MNSEEYVHELTAPFLELSSYVKLFLRCLAQLGLTKATANNQANTLDMIRKSKYLLQKTTTSDV